MTGRGISVGRKLLLATSLAGLLLGCGVAPTEQAAATPTPGMRFLMPTPGTPPAPAVPTSTPVVVTYIVQSGDTLYDIALRYDVEIEAIIEANDLTDPDTLQVGQELIIPVEPEEVEPTETPTL